MDIVGSGWGNIVSSWHSVDCICFVCLQQLHVLWFVFFGDSDCKCSGKFVTGEGEECSSGQFVTFAMCRSHRNHSSTGTTNPVLGILQVSLISSSCLPHILRLSFHRFNHVRLDTPHGLIRIASCENILLSDTLSFNWLLGWIYTSSWVYWSRVLLSLLLLDIQKHFYQLGHVEVGECSQVATGITRVGNRLLFLICTHVHSLCRCGKYYHRDWILLHYSCQYINSALQSTIISLSFWRFQSLF